MSAAAMLTRIFVIGLWQLWDETRIVVWVMPNSLFDLRFRCQSHIEDGFCLRQSVFG
jgi:hypothetical protein